MLRHPDAPSGQITRRHLDSYGAGWFAKLKIDGWRCVAIRSKGSFTYLSKLLRPITVRPDVRQDFEIRANVIEGDFILDCELTGNRRAGDAVALYVLDALEVPSLGIYCLTPALKRWEACRKLFPDMAVTAVRDGFGRFFDDSQRDPLAEGVVLFKENAVWIGSMTGPAPNKGIIKCKWRGGMSGTTPTI